MTDRITITDVEYLTESSDAILIETSDEDEIWIPKSLCEWNDDEATLHIEDWKAEELGLI